MATKRAQRLTLTRAGLASMLLGAAIALSAMGSPASAAPKDDAHKVTICHRTNSVTNPYTFNTVDFDSVDGSLGNGNNDHTHHLGPAFDFSADPAVAYPAPHNGDQWGDIIPPYGGFPGMNWTGDGPAIYANGCTAPVPCGPNTTACEPPPCVPGTANNQCVPCPEGNTADGQGGCTPPLCTPTTNNNQCIPCPDGQTADGQGGCTVPPPPGEQLTPTPPAGNDVLGEVLTQSPAPVVQAAQVEAATLPRTGRNSGAMAEVGFGLVLLGLGAVLASRRDELLA